MRIYPEETVRKAQDAEFIRLVACGTTAKEAYKQAISADMDDNSLRSLATRKKAKYATEIEAMQNEIIQQAKEETIKRQVMTKVQAEEMATRIALNNECEDPKIALQAIKQLSEMEGWDEPHEIVSRVSVNETYDRNRLMRIAGVIAEAGPLEPSH